MIRFERRNKEAVVAGRNWFRTVLRRMVNMIEGEMHPITKLLMKVEEVQSQGKFG
jgi:hypothetical protein